MMTELSLYNLDALLEMYRHNFRCQICRFENVIVNQYVYINLL